MKILIVGAGPIGCYTAKLLKKRDKSLDITIIEEHSKIGRPVHCSGIVSKGVISENKIRLTRDVVLNRIDGAEFFLNGDSFRIKRKGVALIIDREKFDRELGSGLKVEFDTKFMGIEKENGKYLVETDKGEYYADIVIGADGANSSLRKAGGFQEDIEYLRGVQYRIRSKKYNKSFVRVYIRGEYFGWIIPESASVVRAGIISGNPYHDLTSFLKDESVEGDVIEKFGGVVPLGTCSTRNGNLFLVGDAACQVKPLTHGGIYYGMRCAEILADCITSGIAVDYEKLWQEKFAREIGIGLKVRKLYNSLDSGNLVKLFYLLKSNKTMLEECGDFEVHSKVIYKLIKNAKVWSLLGDVFLNVISSFYLK
jgi:digeranylgeranylglycerophospholipid reductase